MYSEKIEYIGLLREKTLPFNELKNKYYENSFCYVRPSARGGATAMHELAHMGRRTIGLGFPRIRILYRIY